jgi:hypothetical protein
MPFALGEMLHVTLRDGREWTAPFAGHGELTLVLRSPEGPQFLRVPFEFAREIRRANGERIEPKALIRAFQDGALPSAEALALGEIVPLESMVDQWGSALRVAVEDIRSVSAQLPGGSNSAAGNAAGIVILSVVATLVLIGVALSSSSSGCSSPNIDIPNFLGVQLTTRPFDLDRGCFVGDALAVAEVPAEPAPVAAVDVPATSQLPDWTSSQLARRSTSTSR